MNLINALEVPLEQNLAAFSQYLYRQQIRHRITEEGMNQVLWVVSEADALQVRTAYRSFQAGELALPALQDDPSEAPLLPRLVHQLFRFPLTLSLILLSLLLAPIGMGLQFEGVTVLLKQMTFLSTEEVIGNSYFRSLAQTLDQGEYWRLLTPMFLHFSIIHIVFNLLWVWEVGRRIELRLGAWVLLLVVLASSLIANFTEYLLSGPVLFGGMSGVVFGLLGFSFVWSRARPEKSMGLPDGIYFFMAVFLAFGFTGLLDRLGMGSIANGAHLGGMVGGMLIAGLAVLLLNRDSSRQR